MNLFASNVTELYLSKQQVSNKIISRISVIWTVDYYSNLIYLSLKPWISVPYCHIYQIFHVICVYLHLFVWKIIICSVTCEQVTYDIIRIEFGFIQVCDTEKSKCRKFFGQNNFVNNLTIQTNCWKIKPVSTKWLF